MATLDTLPPQGRAIIELLVRQRQGYDDLAAKLDMPPARVRELAREALAALAPATARRVDEDWRDQVADYVLGQQSGPEATATRSHLKRSEPARAWVASLLDSLDPLYGDGDRPEIPEAGGAPDGAAGAESGSRRRRKAAATAAAGLGASSADAHDDASAGDSPGATATRSGGDRDRRGVEPAERSRGDGDAGVGGGGRPRGELSPEARSIVRRRRIIAGALAAGVVAIVLAIVLIGGGGEERERASRPTAGGNQSQARLVGQARLDAVGGGDAEGVAVIAERGGRFQLLVQARGLEPAGRGVAYEVWLYRSPDEAVSLGGQVTDNRGTLQGAGPLRPNFRSYRYIDISREKVDRNPKHSGRSVLRVSVSDLLRGGAAAAARGAAVPGGGGAGGGGGAPAP